MLRIQNTIVIIFIGFWIAACSLRSGTGPVYLNQNLQSSDQASVSLATSSAVRNDLKIEGVIKSIINVSQVGLDPALEMNFWNPENILSIPYFYLAPGQYEIKLHGSWDKYWINSGSGYTYSENTVRVTLAAGHKYMPIVQQQNTKIDFSIIDLGTEFNPKCFPYYQKNILEKMDIGRSEANEMTNYAKNYACDWK